MTATLNQTCYVRIVAPKASRTEWMLATIVSVNPLQAKVLDDHPIWHGAVVKRDDDICIRVDQRCWPNHDRESKPTGIADGSIIFQLTSQGWQLAERLKQKPRRGPLDQQRNRQLASVA